MKKPVENKSNTGNATKQTKKKKKKKGEINKLYNVNANFNFQEITS